MAKLAFFLPGHLSSSALAFPLSAAPEGYCFQAYVLK